MKITIEIPNVKQAVVDHLATVIESLASFIGFEYSFHAVQEDGTIYRQVN